MKKKNVDWAYYANIALRSTRWYQSQDKRAHLFFSLSFSPSSSSSNVISVISQEKRDANGKQSNLF
jgi:hypothetical protein